MTDLEYRELLLSLEAESQEEEKKKRGRKPGQIAYELLKVCDASINPPRHNLAGKTFGRLTVTNQYRRNGSHKMMYIEWFCNCSCGNTKWVRATPMVHGSVQSCGCLRKEKAQFNIPNVKLYHQRLQERINSLSNDPTE